MRCAVPGAIRMFTLGLGRATGTPYLPSPQGLLRCFDKDPLQSKGSRQVMMLIARLAAW